MFDYYSQIRKQYQPEFDKGISSIINDFNSSFIFHKSLPGYNSSPLYSLENLANELSVSRIYCKNEGERFGVPAIKLLGASWAMHKTLNKKSDMDTFCTATDGNHGRAVAWSARHFNRSAVVFVPKNTVQSRIRNIENEGAKVIVVQDDYDAAVKAAEKFSIEKNCCLIQDTAWHGYFEIPALITSGYYTQMAEIELQTNHFENAIDVVILQTGVGSWPSAITHFIRNHPKLVNTKIVCVEPFESDCFLESAKNESRSTTKKSQDTIMAGLNCGTPSLLAWEILNRGTDVFLSIDDSYAVQAMKSFYYPKGSDIRIKAGESGAAGLAALLAIMTEPKLKNVKSMLRLGKSSNVLLFNTEDITDPDSFRTYISHSSI